MGLGCVDDVGRVSRDRLRGLPQQLQNLPMHIRVTDTQQEQNDITYDKGSKKLLVDDWTMLAGGGSPTGWDSDDEIDMKTTKRDGAKAQVENWNRELYQTLGIPQSDVCDATLETIRGGLLAWFKRKSTNRYFWWIECQDCQFPHGRHLVRFTTELAELATGTQLHSPRYC